MDHPLKDWSDLAAYRCPAVDMSVEARAKLRKDFDDQEKAGYIRWGGAGNLFERMQYLRGVQEFFMDVALYPEEVCRLADKIVDDYLIPNIEKAVEAKADVIMFIDDWGTQSALLINPKSFREIFKPRYKKMFELARQGGALVWLHSDGMILEIIPDLIEIGLDVINPQGNCIDLQEMRRITQGKLHIHMDTDRQGRLPFGTPQEIDDYVKELARIFGDPRGGLSFHGAFDAQMPLANVEACLKAFHTYSRFGLR
jgi:uroporphyrinogen-III decarboxylase